MIRELMTRLWKDESGSIIATEYLMLGTVVAIGSVGGMTTIRDTVNEEYQEYGNTLREVRQAHSKPVTGPAAKGRPGQTVGTIGEVPEVPTSQAAAVTFACP
jgi:Flp pilus assembly pilin Flp